MRNITDCHVAVIGGAGFLGSHLVNHLIEDRRCQVTVIDNLVVGLLKFVHPSASFVHHDICGSEEFLHTLFTNRKIDFVFNYAAWPYIPDSFDRPAQVFAVNATGAIKVINAAHAAGCKGILQVSSAEIYGDSCHGTLTEESPVISHSTYGVSKVAVDGYVQVRWKEAQTPAIAMRQFNCVGERETHPYVIPEIIAQIDRKGPNIQLGNNSFRDFQYAGDAVRMAVQLLENGRFGEVYNMGSETGLKIYELAQLIGRLMGHQYITITQDPARIRPWEIWSLLSDNSKLYSVIDRPIRTPLEEALQRTIADYTGNGRKWAWE
jgi:nucleoside-diphosphate-sugar epimerase